MDRRRRTSCSWRKKCCKSSWMLWPEGTRVRCPCCWSSSDTEIGRGWWWSFAERRSCCHTTRFWSNTSFWLYQNGSRLGCIWFNCSARDCNCQVMWGHWEAMGSRDSWTYERPEEKQGTRKRQMWTFFWWSRSKKLWYLPVLWEIWALVSWLLKKKTRQWVKLRRGCGEKRDGSELLLLQKEREIGEKEHTTQAYIS